MDFSYICEAGETEFKFSQSYNNVKYYIVTTDVGINYVVWGLDYKRYLFGYLSLKTIFTPLF